MKLALTLIAGAALAVAGATAAQAADLLKPADPIYSSPLFNFEGMYVGATAGLASYSSAGYGSVGVVVGSNFAVTDGIVVGGEFQGDVYFNGGFSAADAPGARPRGRLHRRQHHDLRPTSASASSTPRRSMPSAPAPKLA